MIFELRVQLGWGSDDRKKEVKEFKSAQEMIDYAFTIHDQIILHKLSPNPKDTTYVADDKGEPLDYFIMIYDKKVEE